MSVTVVKDNAYVQFGAYLTRFGLWSARYGDLFGSLACNVCRRILGGIFRINGADVPFVQPVGLSDEE